MSLFSSSHNIPCWGPRLLQLGGEERRRLIHAAERQRLCPVEELEGVELPVLQEQIQSTLWKGSGVVRILGLGGLEEGLMRRAYALLAAGIGTPIDSYGRQYDVIDRGLDYRKAAIPVSQTSAETAFHTDSSSRWMNPAVVGLLCIRPALEGGLSMVSPAWKAEEQVGKARPELLRLLQADYVRDVVTPGVDTERVSLNRFPIFSRGPQGLIFRYMRYWIEKGQARVGQPLGSEQLEALDLLDHALARNSRCFAMSPGEVLFIDNYRVAHNRTAYQDNPTAPRLLVRMWMGDAQSATPS
jgi:hypothetical protein